MTKQNKDWPKNIEEMHDHYNIRPWIENLVDPEKLSAEGYKLREFLKFRLDFVEEELNETRKAVVEKDPEEIVDGLIDICVVALGTLDLFGVNAQKAWLEVLNANMKKKVGQKPGRENEHGFPDLVKDPDWEAPSHNGNHGILHDVVNAPNKQE